MILPPCPECGCESDRNAKSLIDGGRDEPRDGDLGVCGQCGALLEVYDGGKVKTLTRGTARQVRSADLAVMYAAQAWVRSRKRRPVP